MIFPYFSRKYEEWNVGFKPCKLDENTFFFKVEQNTPGISAVRGGHFLFRVGGGG